MAGEAGEKLRVAAAEADGIILTGDTSDLFIGCLEFVNADESAKGPRLIGGELLLEEVSDLDLSGFH